jgi:short-subunit dehydrogenase
LIHVPRRMKSQEYGSWARQLGKKKIVRAGDFVFENKVVVVTGGSSGIGKQLAEDLLVLGARVVICSHEPLPLEKARVELAEFGQVDAFVCDVRDALQVNRLADYVLKKHGHTDILVNNAGYAVFRPFEESSVDEVLDLLDVNLAGAMRCTKAFLPDMIGLGCGRIVNISSIGGATIITPNAVYCAAKQGMIAWSRAIRYELAHFNISVNVVCPDHVKTNFQNHPSFQRREIYRAKDPARKLGRHSLTVEQVSESILDAIRRDRVVTYVPHWQGLVVWALNGLPVFTRPIWDRIMRKRIVQLYEQIKVEKQGTIATG